jgi:hypothetical protein
MPIARVAQNFHSCRREEQKYAVAIFVRVIKLQEHLLFVVYGDGLALVFDYQVLARNVLLDRSFD